jgi:hypothetical protein
VARTQNSAPTVRRQLEGHRKLLVECGAHSRSSVDQVLHAHDVPCLPRDPNDLVVGEADAVAADLPDAITTGRVANSADGTGKRD